MSAGSQRAADHDGSALARVTDSGAEWRAVRPIVVAWVVTDVLWALLVIRTIRCLRRQARPVAPPG
jgi:hypothetical protein